MVKGAGEGNYPKKATILSISVKGGRLFEGGSGLKITDSRLPVMMTGQIFFSLDKPRFWPVK